MNTYELVKAGKSGPDWNAVVTVELTNRLWLPADGISAWAQACYDEQYLYVRLHSRGEAILRRYTGENDPVCTDSCLEFFFAPNEKADRYFNVEVNPNGACYFGFGRLRGDRYRVLRKDLPEVLQIKPFDTEGGWGVEFAVPVHEVQTFCPDFQLCAGTVLKGNFYKCAEDSATPHFMTWNYVAAEKPDFHRPECFGALVCK